MTENNPFKGKRHTDDVRMQISEMRKGMTGKIKMPPSFGEAISKRLTGVPRSDETKKKLHDHNIQLPDDFGHCLKKAATSKTKGKRGFFYVAKVSDGLLKFGSASSVDYRLKKLKAEHGSAELLLAVEVDDAAGYEALMMEKNRKHWVRGELFSNFLSGQAPV